MKIYDQKSVKSQAKLVSQVKLKECTVYICIVCLYIHPSHIYTYHIYLYILIYNWA